MNHSASDWHHLADAPHRGMFLAGALQGMLTLLWWVFDLAGRYGIAGTAFAWSIAPTWAHAFLMIYGFFSFFILGFLFTTFPNWMNGEKIQPRQYVASCLLMSAGVGLFYLGLATGERIVAAGVATLLAGLSIAVYALLCTLSKAKDQDRRHAFAASAALVSGWLGIAAYLLWLLTENTALLDFSRIAGIWFFLLPIVMTVSHRMIPFFSSRVLENYVLVRPYWILWLMLACSAGHGLLQSWGAAFSYLWVFDLPLAACAFYLSFTWGLLRSFRIHLLAVLHIAFAWLGLSMLLYGTQSLVFFASGGKLVIFGHAPLHALAIGYFASMVLGMASRVTLGHSGHPLVLDKLSWLLFMGFQTAALFRILPDLLPAAASLAPSLYLLAGLAWLICFTLWAGRYAPLYWRQRVDGKPG
ncbi:MAG: NnrS family protein [Nitrosospira sp.]